MNPVISFVVGDLAIHTTSYRLFMVMGVLATVGLGYAVAICRGLQGHRVALCLLAITVAFPLGARLFDAVTKLGYYLEKPARLLSLDLGGFSMWGGLILAAAVGVMACRLLALNLPRMADSAMPGLGIGIALMRMGCFMAGCCFGKETDLPWGVTFPPGSDAHIHQLLADGSIIFGGDPRPVHPTQLYESVAALLAVAFVFWLFKRAAPDGIAFLSCACWYSAFRLFNHYLRVPGGELTVPGWFYPVLYSLVLMVAGGALIWRTFRHRSSPNLRGGRPARLSAAATSITQQQL